MSTKIMSSDNKHELYHTFYTPNAANDEAAPEVKATLLIVHGMAEHSGRYREFAQFLADEGIAVLTYDQLGHGRTVAPDELGYFSDEHPMQKLLKDVVTMADVLKSKYPDAPHFVMGHSMGSFIVRNVLQHHYQDFTGAILMGTSDTEPLINVLYPLTKVLNKLRPKAPNPVFGKATNLLLNSKLKDKESDSDFAWVAHNPEAIGDYENDPLCGFNFTNNGFLTLFDLINRGLTKDWAKTIKQDFPMLFISGEEDPVGNMGKGIRTLVERMTDEQGFKNIDMQLYSGMRHEPLNETYPEPVYHDILAWILARAKNSDSKE